jgi:hypothetical protein
MPLTILAQSIYPAGLVVSVSVILQALANTWLVNQTDDLTAPPYAKALAFIGSAQFHSSSVGPGHAKIVPESAIWAVAPVSE